MAADNTAMVLSALTPQQKLEWFQTQEHSHCLFCGKSNPIGFQLGFRVKESGSVTAEFSCGRLYQSYPAMLHGGVTSALLDAAMTNCLFGEGIAAVTGELTVRYLNPVAVDCRAEVSARLEHVCYPLYRLSAELSQDGRVVARASAKFVSRSWSAAVAPESPL